VNLFDLKPGGKHYGIEKKSEKKKNTRYIPKKPKPQKRHPLLFSFKTEGLSH